MSKIFKRGDHVEWNSEAGRVRGVIIKKVITDVLFKAYVHHASKDTPQYFIRSDKTDHVAIHKGTALKLRSIRRVILCGALSKSIFSTWALPRERVCLLALTCLVGIYGKGFTSK